MPLLSLCLDQRTNVILTRYFRIVNVVFYFAQFRIFRQFGASVQYSGSAIHFLFHFTFTKSSRTNILWYNCLYCDMLPPLKSQILKWGLLAQRLYWAKYLQAILACPAIHFTQLWDIFIVWIQTLSIYPANNIRRAYSRILIAAFRSRSIRFPHVQRYTLSDSFSSFFILPHLQHFLLEGKKRSTHTNLFPLHASLYSSNSRNFP